MVAMGIVLGAVVQLFISRQVHPGAVVVVGPVSIIPYAMAWAQPRGIRLPFYLNMIAASSCVECSGGVSDALGIPDPPWNRQPTLQASAFYTRSA